MSEKIVLVVGAAALVAAILFAAVILGTAFGAAAGWAVGLAFETPFNTLNSLSSLTLDPWQWGATLGFVGSFFRSSNTNNCKS